MILFPQESHFIVLYRLKIKNKTKTKIIVPVRKRLALMLLTLHTTINSNNINNVTPNATSLTKS